MKHYGYTSGFELNLDNQKTVGRKRYEVEITYCPIRFRVVPSMILVLLEFLNH
jgi:hypothetical protein